jgi:CHAD domain-containing protein
VENSNLLYEHWKMERQHFERNLNKLKKTITIKAVHDIRVCIKKMKAYRNLFYLLNEDESRIKFKQTNKLFDVLGKLRNIHICLELIADHEKKGDNNNCPDLRDFLNGKIKQAKSWSKRSIKNYNEKELSEFELLLAAMQTNNQEESIESKINSKLKELEEMTSQPHEIRRGLKKVSYWIKTLPEEQADQNYKTEKLNDVTDQLGAWQDHEVLLKEIRYFTKEFLPSSSDENKRLKALQKIIKEKKQSLTDEALNKPDFVKK